MSCSSWEAHIRFLEEKLNSCIVMIKRIRKYVPQTEYLKIYNALFMSHLSYCISCWGGVPSYKLEKIFSIQKRCVRNMCPSEDHNATRDFTLEHTKPLFNEKEILNLENLYLYHTFMETFKIMKFSAPISMRSVVKFLPRSEKLKLEVPLDRLDVSQQNFVF